MSETDQACLRATAPMDRLQCQSAYQPVNSSLVDFSQPAVTASLLSYPAVLRVGWRAVRSLSAWSCRCLRDSRCWGWKCLRWSNARWCYRPCSPGSWHKTQKTLSVSDMHNWKLLKLYNLLAWNWEMKVMYLFHSPFFTFLVHFGYSLRGHAVLLWYLRISNENSM